MLAVGVSHAGLKQEALRLSSSQLKAMHGQSVHENLDSLIQLALRVSPVTADISCNWLAMSTMTAWFGMYCSLQLVHHKHVLHRGSLLQHKLMQAGFAVTEAFIYSTLWAINSSISQKKRISLMPRLVLGPRRGLDW